ncbi:hypothetical protein NliqN6_6223 [Naganishia liquefaciens]|uniref:Tethering factor for nuclear proteasome STS1 n=1 Tax=Naganishia liquefaciens TaxID=104408 RepID=A0A8H3TY93_9TREE|nr:hypothetical protein NliqN6_6223 [Naganishia liquefaciens]
MPAGSHPLGFGAVQSSSTRVSSPLATSFGFGNTAAAGPSTPTVTNPYAYPWASPHQQQAVSNTHYASSTTNPNPNPFAHAWARAGSSSSSSASASGSTSLHRAPSGASQTTYDPTLTSSHAKRRRSGSEDAIMERTEVEASPLAGRTMKRLRQARQTQSSSGSELTQEDEPDGDLGVLLASLPASTHLQILHALIASHPDLKPVIHALVPAPEISFAAQVLDEKAQRLVEAVPIGAHSHEEHRRPSRAAFGFGGSMTTTAAPPTATRASGTVSDGYIVNRLRGPLTEFTNVATTYLPYFTSRSTPTGDNKPTPTPAPTPTTAAPPPPHPSTSFQYLSHLTTLLITRIFPNIPSSALHSSSPDTLPQLSALTRTLTSAWQSWLAHISEHVNAHAGMYAASMAQGWITGIETLATQAERAVAERTVQGQGKLRGPADELARQMKALAVSWVEQVGWLIGRSVPQGEMNDRMDE